MKNYFNLLFSLCICFNSINANSQTAGTAALMEVKNMIQLNDHQFTYEIWLTNTGTTSLALHAFSCGLNYTPGLANGGTLSHTFVSSDAGPYFATHIVGNLTSSLNHIRTTSALAVNGQDYSLSFGVPVRLATMKLSTTTNFTGLGNNYNPFNPPLPLSPMQLLVAAGRIACRATCFVNSSSNTYDLLSSGNLPSSAALNVMNCQYNINTVLNQQNASILNIRCFIESYWNSNNTMAPALYNQLVSGNTNSCDSIDLELRDENAPHALIQTRRTLLNTDGTAQAVFSNLNGSYFIVLKHRNALETWSASPVTFGNTPVSYDFTNDANKAFGNNQVEVSPGVWAIHSGDLFKDENIDNLDFFQVEDDILKFSYGYFATDLNGDGNVDLLDKPILETNMYNFIYSSHP